MKKQLSLIAITGAAIVLASAGAQAQQPAGAVGFDPKAAGDFTITGAQNSKGFHSTQAGPAWSNGTGANANLFTASGTIQKYIKFKTVDSNLELGDLGNPTETGFVVSNAAAAGTVVSMANVAPSTVAGNENGLAGVTFDANTYVQVQAEGQQSLLNIGADGVESGDDYRLQVAYAMRAKGLYTKPAPTPGSGGTNTVKPHSDYSHGTSGYSVLSTFVDAAGTGGPQGITGTAGTVTAATNMFVTFEPNGGGGNVGSNGFQIAAKVKRNGLNDYHGLYKGDVKLSYWQW